MDNENIITLLDGKTPDEAWQEMQDKARSSRRRVDIHVHRPGV